MKRPSLLLRHWRQQQVEVAGKSLGGFEIVIECHNGVAKASTKMIDHANHAKRHASDPETREDVENVRA
jgi:hypothetical protein